MGLPSYIFLLFLAPAGLSLRFPPSSPFPRREVLRVPTQVLVGVAATLLPGPARAELEEFSVLFAEGPVGMELGDSKATLSSGQARVVIRKVLGGQAIRQPSLQPGLGVVSVGGQPVLLKSASDVARLIKVTPRPVEIVFQSQLPKPVTAPAVAQEEYSVKRTRVPGSCNIKTRAGDLIEIHYTAYLAEDMTEFDSSRSRGTGTPYALVLGNGEVIKGLDLAMFDQCISEMRRVVIPPRLGYGEKGSKAFKVPPGATLIYDVEVVSINSVYESERGRDNFYVDAPCDKDAFAAGNASGRCRQIEEQYLEQR
ncbi:unnamed protein product [Chrysoparadoxa australica]